MAFPPQTPGYQRQLNKGVGRRVIIFAALLSGGGIVIAIGVVLRTVLPGVVWLGVVVLGVVLMVLSVLIAVRWVIAFNARVKKDRALREPGTVELLTTATSKVMWGEDESWKLTSDLQIRLDGGHTFSGSYQTIQPLKNRPGVKPFDAWFRVGASMRCRYNPTNPDRVLVFPFAEKGGVEVSYNEIAIAGPDHVWFWSAT